MDFDIFGMGDFSFDEISCDILMIGPIVKEMGFSGETAWQSAILSPFGYEISIVDYMDTEEESKWLAEEAKKIGVMTTKDPYHDAEKCKVLSVNGLFHDRMMDFEELKKVLKIAKENQSLVCLDPGPISDVEGAKTILKEIAPYIDHFLPNEEEAAQLSGEKIMPIMAQSFLDMGMKNVVITTGSNGCFVRGDGAPFAMGAIWGETKDLTGVGANYAAGFIYGLFQDWQMKTVCEFATGCAAVSAKYLDPVEGARNRKDEIKSILNNPYM